MKNKQLVLSIVFIFSILFMSAGTDTGDVKTKIVKLEEQLHEKNYTRIPNQDFETLIDNKITHTVNDKLGFWLGTIAGIIALLSASVTIAFNYIMKDLVSKRVNELSEELKLKSEKRLEKIESFLSDTKREYHRIQHETIQEKLKTRPLPEGIANELGSLLIKSDEINDSELTVKVIDDLAGVYYEFKKTKELSDLIKNYGTKYDIKERTYLNSAIDLMDLYEIHNAKAYREDALKYCAVAIDKLPDYGEPRAIMLDIYMIDLVRAQNENEKNEIRERALRLLNEINQGSFPLISFETFNRLERDRKVSRFTPYVDKLYEVFPEEMKLLKERSEKYNALYLNPDKQVAVKNN